MGPCHEKLANNKNKYLSANRCSLFTFKIAQCISHILFKPSYSRSSMQRHMNYARVCVWGGGGMGDASVVERRTWVAYVEI